MTRLTLEDRMKDDLCEEEVTPVGDEYHVTNLYGVVYLLDSNHVVVLQGDRAPSVADMQGVAKRFNALETLRELASLLITNAEMIPDPRREGATDCYAVTLDDLEALRAALALGDGPTKGTGDEINVPRTS